MDTYFKESEYLSNQSKLSNEDKPKYTTKKNDDTLTLKTYVSKRRWIKLKNNYIIKIKINNVCMYYRRIMIYVNQNKIKHNKNTNYS